MNDQTDLTTLQRKAGAGRAPFEGAGMTPVKALRLALSRGAQDELALAARVVSVREERVNQAHLLDVLEPDALLMLLEGPQGSRGLAVFDPQVLAAVIEVQTKGHVTRTAAAPRPPTRTDSAMCEMVLDRIMQEFEGHLADTKAASWATGFRFGERIIGVRLLGLALADVEYRLFRLSLDLAEGAKTGDMLLAVPAVGCGAVRPVSNSTDSWEQTLEKTVCASHVEIRAVLHRAEVPLDMARNYKAGDLVSVPKSAVTKILMEGLDGRVVAQARLGQQDGFRALRLAQGDGAAISSDIGLPPALEGGADATMDVATGPLPEIDIAAGSPDIFEQAAPMTPMDVLPMDDPVDMPTAAMPVDMEIG